MPALGEPFGQGGRAGTAEAGGAGGPGGAGQAGAGGTGVGEERRSLLAKAAFHVLVPLSYALGSALLFANAWRPPGTALIGGISDSTQLSWFLGWTAHALTHDQSILFTTALNAPSGANLAWNTSMPLLGIVASPITLRWGPVVAYDVMLCAAFATTAWAMCGAVLHFGGGRLLSWLAGAALALCPFMVAQSMGHLFLVFMAYVPAALVLSHLILVRRRPPWWLLGGVLGLITGAQLYISQETVAAVAVAAVVGGVVLAAQRPSGWRAQAPRALGALAVATFVTLVVAAPLLLTQFAGAQRPVGFREVGDNWLGNDLTALVVPSAQQWLAPAPALRVAARWQAQSTGQVAYLGIFGLALLGMATVARRRDLTVRTLAIVSLVLLVLSLGPRLSVGGVDLGVPLPEIALQHLPVLDNVVPLRFAFYAQAGAVATAALALARQPPGRLRVVMAGLGALTLVTWFPSLPRPLLPNPVPAALPAPVSAQVPDGSTVLFVPCASTGNTDAMYYQAVSGYRWKLVGGYVYRRSNGSPVAQGLCGGSPPPAEPQGVTLGLALRQEGVGLVMVPPGASAQAARLTAALGRQPRVTAGFSLWDTGVG